MRARQRVVGDIERKSGTFRLIVGSRGGGKSTCLEYLREFATEEIGRVRTTDFDAGLLIPDLLEMTTEQRVNHLLRELALSISAGKEGSISKVAEKVSGSKVAPLFLFVDNLDRFYQSEADREFIRSFFRLADPTLKALAKKTVIVISCAPEWERFLKGEDLSYLNFQNRIELQPLTELEIKQMINARLASFGHKSEEFFADDLMPALSLASKGNPRLVFQLLERVFNRTDNFPIDAEQFQALVRTELFEAALDKLRAIATRSERISWGVNELWRFFDSLQKAGIDGQKGVDLVLAAHERGSLKDHQVQDLRFAFRRIGHREPKSQSWILNEQVRNALTDWSRESGIARHALLTAFSENPFTVSTTDVEDAIDKLRSAAEPIPQAAEYLDEGLKLYMSINAWKTTEGDRRKLVLDAWRCVERLGLAILAVRNAEFPVKLHHALEGDSSSKEATLELLEHLDDIYYSIDRADPYRSELRALRERMLDVSYHPEVVAHWVDQQLEHTKQQALSSFEGLARTLTPDRMKVTAPDRRVQQALFLIRQGESATVEFKSALRWDVHQRKTNDDIERMTLKTIAGFLNAQGGTLLIGVGDNGEIVGVEQDYQTFKKRDSDGFEQHVITLVSERMGKHICSLVTLQFVTLEEKDLAIVSVSTSPDPVFLEEAGGKRFYVRTGNSTQAFDAEETQKYVRRHWHG